MSKSFISFEILTNEEIRDGEWIYILEVCQIEEFTLRNLYTKISFIDKENNSLNYILY